MSTTNTPTPQELSKAVALFYDGNQAPTVLAKGEDDLAAQILALANEHKIPICNNPALADLLNLLEVGDHIPPELYTAIAHIIAFAYSLKDTRHFTSEPPH